jgi:lipopolysaccharide export system ATP-binding protein
MKDQTMPSCGSTLVVRGLQKSYGKRLVVRDVSLQVDCGEVVGLLGPNGAGKTTSFYMIVGLVPADEGAIEIDGTDVTRLAIHRRALLGLSYLPQEASVFRKLTVEDNIRAVLELQKDESGKALTREAIDTRLDKLLSDLQIEKLRETRRCRCRAASAAVSRSPARWPPIRASCCSTNRSPASIRSR